MVPEPLSLPPGAYDSAVSVSRRSQQSIHSHVVSETIHASHNDRRSTPSTAGPPCLRIYWQARCAYVNINVQEAGLKKRPTYQTTLGE